MTSTQLYVVATPIGNLEDITLRALNVLKEADVILCEDTRVTHKLLTHYGINGKPLLRLNEYSPKTLAYLGRQIAGKKSALVTDSGTPAISDPASRFIEFLAGAPASGGSAVPPSTASGGLAKEMGGLRVVPIPGPSAVAAAVSISGMARDGFVFLGYLGRSKSKIVKEITAALAMKKAVVFYESPHRILSTLEILAERWPDAKILLARELTKQHEEILRTNAVEALSQLKAKERILGEFTVVLEALP